MLDTVAIVGDRTDLGQVSRLPMRLPAMRSIRVRIIVGFSTMLLLQAGVAAAVWNADNRMDDATIAEARVSAASERNAAAFTALRSARLSLSDYLRTGGADDKAAIERAISDLETEMAAEHGSLLHPASLGLVRTSLATVVQASQAKRDSAARVGQIAAEVSNGFTALTQAALGAPERATVDSIATAIAAALPLMSAVVRYAVGEDTRDSAIVHAGLGRTRDELQALLDGTAAPPGRVRRLIGTTLVSLDDIGPAMAKLDAAVLGRTGAMAQVEQAVAQAHLSIQQSNAQLAVERDRRQGEMQRAREAVRVGPRSIPALTKPSQHQPN